MPNPSPEHVCKPSCHNPCLLDDEKVRKPKPSAAPSESRALEHSRSCSAGYDFESQCTCGLEYRIQLQTEREMHNAWRKRAEEAEAALAAAERDIREQLGQLIDEAKEDYPAELFVHLDNFREKQCFDCCAAKSAIHTLTWLAELVRGKGAQ